MNWSACGFVIKLFTFLQHVFTSSSEIIPNSSLLGDIFYHIYNMNLMNIDIIIN